MCTHCCGLHRCIYCSIWLLAGISFKCYCSVQYKLWHWCLYVVSSAVVSEVLSFMHCSIVIVVQYLWTNAVRNANSFLVCYEDFTPEQLRLVLPVWLQLPWFSLSSPMGVIIIFSYWPFVRFMLSQPQLGTRRHWRVTGCYDFLPFRALLWALQCVSCGRVFQESSQNWQSCAVLLSTLNMCIDTLIFYFSYLSCVQSLW